VRRDHRRQTARSLSVAKPSARAATWTMRGKRCNNRRTWAVRRNLKVTSRYQWSREWSNAGPSRWRMPTTHRSPRIAARATPIAPSTTLRSPLAATLQHVFGVVPGARQIERSDGRTQRTDPHAYGCGGSVPVGRWPGLASRQRSSEPNQTRIQQAAAVRFGSGADPGSATRRQAAILAGRVLGGRAKAELSVADG
jgi:hypothetical protein